MHPKTKLILIGCLSLVVFSTSAQYVSNDGRFQVNERKGCAPFEFVFTNLEVGKCTGDENCAIGYFLNGSGQLVEINDNIYY